MNYVDLLDNNITLTVPSQRRERTREQWFFTRGSARPGGRQ